MNTNLQYDKTMIASSLVLLVSHIYVVVILAVLL